MAQTLITLASHLLLISAVLTAPHKVEDVNDSIPKRGTIFSQTKTYTYSYSGKVKVSRTQNETPRELMIRCTIEVSPVSITERRMKIIDFIFSNTKSSNSEMEQDVLGQLRHDISQYDVIFPIRDEEDNIRTHRNEAPLTLNFKRAILSLVKPYNLKFTWPAKVQETQRGPCKVKASTSEDTSQISERTVDLRTCSHLSDITTELETIYPANMDLPTKTLIKWTGSEKCIYHWRTSGEMEKADCSEKLQFKSSSAGTNITIRADKRVDLVDVSSATLTEMSFSGYTRSSPHYTFTDPSFTSPTVTTDVIQKSPVRPAHRRARSVDMGVVTATHHAPPTYTAMLVGENHMVTWDGTSYTLPDYRTKRCAYQLARDISQHSFTLLQSRHMVELVTPRLAVRVRHNGHVLINRASTPSDLPYHSSHGDVTVTRRGPHVLVRTRSGVHLQYDTNTQNTLITLSARYHNHSRGLLGTNDGRRHNHFLTRQGYVTHNIHEVIQSYEVSSRPECHPEVGSPEVRRSAATCDNGVDDFCDEMFSQQESALAPCFGSVNPSPFKTMCQRDARRCYSSSSQAQISVCRVGAAYRDLCRAKGILLETPILCSACGHRRAGANWVQRTDYKVDAVLVSAGRVGGSVTRRLKDLLAVTLKSSSPAYDFRVGVVSTDGHAHSYTFNGELLSHEPQGRAVNDKLSRMRQHMNQPGHHLAEALHLAAGYPFRPHAVKLILLFIDSDVEQEDLSAVISLLTSRGIIVDVLHSYELLIPKKVAGVLPGGQLLTSNGQLFARQVPQTTYAQVALQSGGMLLDPQALSGATRPLVAQALLTQADRQRRSCRRCSCAQHAEICRKVAC